MRGDAYKTYLFLSGASSFLLTTIFVASAVYQVTEVGLSPLQIVLVGTLLEAVCFVFEIPTGIVADLYGRRLSVIISYALIGCGFLLEGSVPTFAAVLAAQFFWGVGATFESGALDAWVADELGEARAAQAFLRVSQVDSVLSVAGIIVGTGLGMAFGVAVPIWLGGLGMIALSLVLARVMPEHGFKPLPRENRNMWQAMTRTFGDGVRVVRAKPILIGLILTGFVHGAFSEGFDRLWTPLALSFALPVIGQLQPIFWTSAMRIGALLLQLPVAELIRRRVRMDDDKQVSRSLVIATVFVLIGLTGLAVAPNFAFVVLAYLVAATARRVTGPILQMWKNRQIRGEDASARATILSMYGQVDAIGQVSGGPVVGAIGNASLGLAMLASAGILSPALFLYGRAGRVAQTEVPPPSSEAR